MLVRPVISGRRVALVAACCAAVGLWTDGLPAGGQSVEPIVVQFSTVGTSTFDVPADVCSITIDAFGAAGGDVGGDRPGGLGGEGQATIAVTPGETLQVRVGGQGGTSATATGGAGGFNGGAPGGDGTNASGGGGGGGASDVRRAPYADAQRLVVGGGGGGAGNAEPLATPAGGDGGGTQGDAGGTGNPTTSPNAGGGGGTQSAAGAGGTIAGGVNGTSGVGSQGGDGADVAALDVSPGGGGGGGWFGGGGGAGGDAAGGNGGGGGGSGFTPDGTGLASGVQAGDGQVTISSAPGSCPPSSPAPAPTPPNAVAAAPLFTG